MRGLVLLIAATMVACSFGTPTIDPAPTKGRRSSMAKAEDNLTDDRTGDDDALLPENGGPLDVEDRSPTTPGYPVPNETPVEPEPVPESVKEIPLAWNGITGFQYAISVKVGASWISNCITAGTATTAKFSGTCAGGITAPIKDVTAYRLHPSNDGTDWRDWVEQPASENVTFKLPSVPSTIDVRWNTVSTTAEYSLDARLADGTFYGPCVGAHLLLKTTSHRFDGTCVTPQKTIKISDLRQLTICSAEGGNWAAAKCVPFHYNGLRSAVTIPN